MQIPKLTRHALPPFSTTDYKNHLHTLNESIDHQITLLGLQAVENIDHFVQLRTQTMDDMLAQVFTQVLSDELALFAIGGYGRGELFPYSDVDMLILGKDVQKHQVAIERFVATLWDIGITPAISVRSIDQTFQDVSDHTVATALLEARLIAGNQTLAQIPKDSIKQAWSIHNFYHAKLAESKTRHLSHHATEYNLEPNIKNGVGTLRDLHILLWLGKFYFDGITNFFDLVKAGFISDTQCSTLTAAQNFLWLIRHHLHTHSGRGEERLLFEYQKAIATLLCADITTDNTRPNQAPEHLMRLYYRHVMQVASLSELLCEYFYECYLHPTQTLTDLDEDFYQSDEPNTKTPTKIGIKDPQTFINKPHTILSIFLLMAQHNIKKISATTLTALHLASQTIDDAYRQNPKHKALFLANLQENNYLFHRLRLMKRFGVLGRYLPAFGQIMGLMQYDLFHRYTVDAHTLLLIRILHRFGDLDNDEYQQKFGLVSEIYQHIHRKDILVIAALFHDIAKGRGGDHSQLGATDGYEFCIHHGMSQEDANFVAWLIQEHLTMSLTAQKQDISDPDVIANFAKFVGNVTKLNHLYVLTVADMNATNSQLWNSWRASLLKQLYLSTYRTLSLGIHTSQKDHLIQTCKQQAQNLLPHINQQHIHQLWSGFGEEYFLKQKPADIAWQTQLILQQKNTLKTTPIIALQNHADLALDAIQLFICIKDQANLFATTVCVLDQLGLSVLDATILTAKINEQTFALDSYILIDRFAKRDNKGSLKSDFLIDEHRQHQLIQKLTQSFVNQCPPTPPKSFELNRQLKHFSVPTQVQFSLATTHAHQGYHVMHLLTKDRPALLAKVGGIFSQLGIKVHGAKITTMGERAEDMFYISDEHENTLTDTALELLKSKLIEILP